jgi:signal transduction histidine kinase
MHYDRWRELSKTFRFRLAAQHVLLVLAALLVSFAISLSVIKSFATTEHQKHLSETMQQVHRDYLGRNLPKENDQLPEGLLQKIEAESPGIRIGMVEREDHPDGWLYEVIGSTGSEQLEILVAESGQPWVALRKPLADVFLVMQETLRKSAIRNLDLSVFSPEGTTILAGNPTSEFPADALAAIHSPEAWPNQQVILKIGRVWIGAVPLYDGNILCISDPQDEVSGIIRLWTRFFALLTLFFLPLSGGIGFHISRRAMAGVERVSATANRVKAGHLNERVAPGAEGTEIETLAADFNGMVEQIEILMRELQDVTANIAHDLRTPIARIRGMIESLNWAEVLPDEREQVAGAAMEECDRIMPLIDSILDLARADSGMLVLQQEPFDLSAEVHTAHAIFSTMAADKQIDFSCTVPKALPMLGDLRLMQRVIANLVDNALKFTPAGGQVSLELKRDGQQAVLTVNDNGPGIPAAERDRVFERFYRFDRSRSSVGYGLGLSLVSAFAKALGGKVAIDSDTGAGCAVTIKVPLGSK